jgi:hypothetical protein
MLSLVCRPDVKLWKHEILWDIYSNSSNYEDVHCPDGPRCISESFSYYVHRFSNQIRHNSITEKCTIICNVFWYIEHIKDSVHEPNGRNQVLFRCQIFFDLFCNLISQWDSRFFMQIFEIKSRFIVVITWSNSFCSSFSRIWSSSVESATRSAFWSPSREYGTECRLNFFQCSVSCMMRKHIAFAGLKCTQSLLHKINGHSQILASRAPARSFRKHRLDRGSTKSSILPLTKWWYHLETACKQGPQAHTLMRVRLEYLRN